MKYLVKKYNVTSWITKDLFGFFLDDGDGKEDRKWEQNPLEKMEEEKLKHLEMT